MNVGLPGTGIGGLFYIVSALWMPAHRALNGSTHDGTDWRRAAGQAAIAAGVLLALFATGWLLGLMFAPGAGTIAGHATVPPAARGAQNVIRWVAVLGTAGLLVCVLVVVETLHLILHARGPDVPAPARAPVTHIETRRTTRVVKRRALSEVA